MKDIQITLKTCRSSRAIAIVTAHWRGKKRRNLAENGVAGRLSCCFCGLRYQREALRHGLATAPIDNFVSEFLPDVALHIHVQIVVIQRIINQVAKLDGVGREGGVSHSGKCCHMQKVEV